MSRRREFLGWLGAGTLLAVSGRGVSAQQANAAPGASGAPAPLSDEWDMSWVDRIRGDSRAVFDVPSQGDGEGVWRAERWRQDYEAVYGVKPADMGAVLVIRHQAIPLIMNNEYWKRYEVGGKSKRDGDGSKKPGGANPVSATHDGATTDSDRYTIQYFIEHGGIVLACHLAFSARIVSNVAKAEKLSQDDAESRAREYIIPGVILQPSGIFAALRAQQAGCAYIFAS